MRFCPFCSAENADEATHCASCARRMPPLPARRQGTATPPPTSSDAPERPARAASPLPPPPPAGDGSGPRVPRPHSRPATLESARAATGTDGGLSRLHLGPAAQRRPAPPPEPRGDGDPARRKTDGRAASEASPASRPTSEPPPIPEGTPPPPRVPRASSATPTPTPTGDADSSVERPTAAGRRSTSAGGTKEPTLPEPPPTRVLAGEDIAHGFKPPRLSPVPEVPEGGLLPAARYALTFARARWQRRAVIRVLNDEIRTETAALDTVLGALGRQVRTLGVDSRALAGENAAIDDAEKRRDRLERENAELAARQADENSKFAEVSGERESKVSAAEARHDKAQSEVASLEAQRRGLRDKRKDIERRQRAYLKSAEDREEQAGKAQLGDQRMALRRAAEDLRRDAAGLDPERQDLERRLAALEKPVSQAAAKLETLKQELDSARRSLNDAREGHRHKLAEIEAEQGRKTRELAQAEAEIQRRLVTLGTLVNLHRVDSPEFDDLYARIDSLRAAIGARSAEIDRLTAEREAYDKASLVRGLVTLGGAIVGFITLLVILFAIF